MAEKQKPQKWYIKLFTLGSTFSSKTFSDNLKKFLLNGIGLFVVVTFTFYVENIGDDYETRQKYIELVEEILGGLDDIIVYTDAYSDRANLYSDMYQNQYEKWELDNDSIFIDIDKNSGKSDKTHYYAPLSLFGFSDSFKPPNLGFEIFKSGNQDFKLVDPYITFIISDIMEGIDLKYLQKNTNEVEEQIVREYKEVLKRWSREMDVTQLDQNKFWIKNRKYIQNDGKFKYLLFQRTQLWESSVKEELELYRKEVLKDKKILDSMINV